MKLPSTVSDASLPNDPSMVVGVRIGSAIGPSASPALSPSTFASPQSSTRVSPNSPSITLSGLTSRWMTPRLCAYASALHRSPKWDKSFRRSVRVSQSLKACLNVRPFTSRIV